MLIQDPLTVRVITNTFDMKHAKSLFKHYIEWENFKFQNNKTIGSNILFVFWGYVTPTACGATVTC